MWKGIDTFYQQRELRHAYIKRIKIQAFEASALRMRSSSSANVLISDPHKLHIRSLISHNNHALKSPKLFPNSKNALKFLKCKKTRCLKT